MREPGQAAGLHADGAATTRDRERSPWQTPIVINRERCTANEQEFWDALETRVTHELAGSDHHRGWCDGFAAEEFALALSRPLGRGSAWLGPAGQDRWSFELRLGGAPTRREDIHRQAQLPVDDTTGWMTRVRRDAHIVIEPGVALRDAPV